MLETFITVALPLAIGIGATYYFANRRSLAYLVKERRVLDPVADTHPGVEIYFEGEKVASLSEWTVAIWNAGNQTINNTDIASPLKLIFQNARLLKAQSIAASRGSTNPNLLVSPDVAEISFEYLDKGDAVAFTIYSVPLGKSSTELKGDIRGVPRGPQHRKINIPSQRTVLIFCITWLFLVGMFVYAVASTISSGRQLGLWRINQTLVPFYANEDRTMEWVFFSFNTFFACVFLIGLISGIRIFLIEYWTIPIWVRAKFLTLATGTRDQEKGALRSNSSPDAPLSGTEE